MQRFPRRLRSASRRRERASAAASGRCGARRQKTGRSSDEHQRGPRRFSRSADSGRAPRPAAGAVRVGGGAGGGDSKRGGAGGTLEAATALATHGDAAGGGARGARRRRRLGSGGGTALGTALTPA